MKVDGFFARSEDGAISFRFVFILQNLAIVEIRFLFWKAVVSRVFLLAGSIAAGAIVGFLIGWEVFGRKNPEP